jgi:hypothetical protein
MTPVIVEYSRQLLHEYVRQLELIVGTFGIIGITVH